MAFDVQGALKEGYSEAEIVDYLAQQKKFDAAGARKEGYSDGEILKHLTTSVPSPKPTQQKYPEQRSLSDEALRQVGLTGRHALEGLTKAFSFPVNAVGSAVAGGLYHLGAKDAARYVESNFGMEGGAKAAAVFPDLNNMPKPENDLERKVGNVAQTMAGGTSGNLVQGLTKNAPAVTKAVVEGLLPSTGSKTALAVNTALGAGMEYAPETTLGVAGTALALPHLRKGGAAVGKGVANLADDALQSSANANFGKGNPNAKIDAEIIQDLAKIKKSINPNGTKGVTLQADDLNGLSNTYLNDLRMKLKSAGVDNQDIEQALMTFKQNAALPEDVLKRLGSSKEGNVALDVIEKARRLRSLVPKENAAGGVARLGRSFLEVAPIPMPIRYAGRSMMGAADPRWMKAEELVEPRSVKAASAFLEKRGPSAATEGMEQLAKLGNAQAAAQASSQAAQAVSAGQAKVALDAAKLKARQVSHTPGGGAYQALQEATGLSTKDLNVTLRDAAKIPELTEAANAIRVKGTNTADGMIYPLTDVVKTIAQKRGMLPSGPLTQTLPAGALSNLEPVSARYQMGTKVRQDIMKEAIAKSGSLGSPEAAKAAKDVGNKLRTTSSAKERLKLIEDLEMKYPETLGLFDAVKQFK